MGKLLLAFFTGVALASFAFFVFEEKPVMRSVERPSEAALSTSTANRDLPPPSEGPAATSEVVPEALPTPPVARDAGLPEDLSRLVRSGYAREDMLEKLSSWTIEDLRALERRAREAAAPSQEMREAESLMGLVRAELGRRRQVATWADAPKPSLSIDLPPEFSWLSQDPSPFHELLQREPVDSTWSVQMETNLRNFFASRPQITGVYGFPTINCRTSGCELAFATYGIDSATRSLEQGVNEARANLLDEFRRATQGLHGQPWATQFSRGTEDRILRVHRGATTFLWHVPRKGE